MTGVPGATSATSVGAPTTELDAAAREYDAARHGDIELITSYHDRRGEVHGVVINLHPEVDWRVIDIAPDGSASLVERLPGVDDRRAQAGALARDYAEQWAAHLRGERPDPPVLHPTPMQMRPCPGERT